MMRIAILTISDSSYAGGRDDLSGPVLAQKCQKLGWEIAARSLLPDDPARITAQIVEWVNEGSADLILTTGGTGIGPDDHTPEATRGVLDRELPGVAEFLRMKGLEQTPLSPLSRGLAGTRKRTLIVNLPGSPQGALFSFEAIVPLVEHAVKLLQGDTKH